MSGTLPWGTIDKYYLAGALYKHPPESKHGGAGGKHWGYEGLIGPTHWHKLFKNACSGREQSPINIQREYTLYDPKLNDFAIWYDPPKPGSKFYLLNNGHTVQVNTFGPFYVANGGLPSVYTTAQFHFHWGDASHRGSEHTVDGKASPIELHVVSYDAETYPKISTAMKEHQGLAVLGVLFDVVEKDNPALEKLIRNFNAIRDPEVKTEVEMDAMPIRDFLPKDTSKYYRYNGSLTTPGCYESVVWTVFEDKQTISERQLDEFRRILKLKKEIGGGSGGRRKRRSSLQHDQEAAAEEVLVELGIKGDPMKELDLALQLEDEQKKEAKQFKAKHSHLKADALKAKENSTKTETSYKVQGVQGDDDTVDMQNIPIAYIQDMLWNNYRPVQPIYERDVYRSFKLYTPPKKVVVLETAYRSNNNNNDWNSGEMIKCNYLLLTLVLSCISMLL
ncbi:hypothetical protein FSP39_017549 [Pinctada imbricata]|uniref:carbonic anhydrase n=1 Tax=Pinctada imbricata TaxID=66713 RepID=A0AA88Y170_PINIB|nr:hypothetical protein FSP39_017549 [Pinctada imbricata]